MLLDLGGHLVAYLVLTDLILGGIIHLNQRLECAIFQLVQKLQLLNLLFELLFLVVLLIELAEYRLLGNLLRLDKVMSTSVILAFESGILVLNVRIY